MTAVTEIEKFLRESDLVGAIDFASKKLPDKRYLVNAMRLNGFIDTCIKGDSRLLWPSCLDEPCLDQILLILKSVSVGEVRFSFPHSLAIAEDRETGKPLELILSKKMENLIK